MCRGLFKASTDILESNSKGKGMPSGQDPSNKMERLRRQVEELIRRRPDLVSRGPGDALDLIDELKSYQAELEIRNEKLKKSREEIHALHKEYESLHEFAPCGYVTLDAKGLITWVNLMAVGLLGNNKKSLLHRGRNAPMAPGGHRGGQGQRRGRDTVAYRSDGHHRA